MQKLSVHLLPTLVDPQQLAGTTCVVIDVLRATTTITTALANGAKEILPCLEVADAHRLAASLPPGSFLLGGERHGRLIEGFDLGNSPAEYTRERIAGKTLIFTTTNGTRALLRCQPARQVLCAAFVNLSAVCRAIADQPEIHILCAGTDGQISREDALVAGAIVQELTAKAPINCELNDEALLARSVWWPLSDVSATALAEELVQSHGGSNLVDLGMKPDLQLAALRDQFPLAPAFDATTNRIRLPGD